MGLLATKSLLLFLGQQQLAIVGLQLHRKQVFIQEAVWLVSLQYITVPCQLGRL